MSISRLYCTVQITLSLFLSLGRLGPSPPVEGRPVEDVEAEEEHWKDDEEEKVCAAVVVPPEGQVDGGSWVETRRGRSALVVANRAAKEPSK